MYKKYLSIYSSSTNSGTVITTKTYRYIRSGIGEVNFRKRASTSAALITRIPAGTKVRLLYSGSVWSRIQYHGREGWVMTKYLSEKK